MRKPLMLLGAVLGLAFLALLMSQPPPTPGSVLPSEELARKESLETAGHIAVVLAIASAAAVAISRGTRFALNEQARINSPIPLGGRAFYSATGTIGEVDLLGNAVQIRSIDGSGQNTTIPLDMIDSVSKASDGRWWLYVRGKFEQIMGEAIHFVHH